MWKDKERKKVRKFSIELYFRQATENQRKYKKEQERTEMCFMQPTKIVLHFHLTIKKSLIKENNKKSRCFSVE